MKILNKIKTLGLVLPVIMLFAMSVTPLVSLSAHAAERTIIGGATSARDKQQSDNLTEEGGIIPLITNIALFIIGALSVIMLVYGGILYATSGGNQEQVTKAKNTILYAIVGIVVAMVAFAVVRFVVESFVSS